MQKFGFTDGIIPDKIHNRLLFQRKVRPDDSLIFFINEKCLAGSSDKIKELSEHGVKIKVIDDCLSDKKDDPYLVTLIQNILGKVKLTKNAKDSVFASDLLRMTNMVQDEGLYSDTDVFFLNKNGSLIISTTHLFGHHNDKTAPDIHIFGIDSYTRKNFHASLVRNLKEFYGGEPPSPNDERLVMMPGIHFLDFLEASGHGHLDFNETKDNVLSGLDQTHAGGEERLHDNAIKDELLKQAKEAVEKINLGNKI
ncbi:Uncharacterised protein [Legionella lansingensis]|uniref:Uncharacterized protein n=1 Tax=Legionella lansingensis TaxID=45067 RepID=A0A0W0VPY7_9GAMM|nr:hypothetical protein [Legionella lansingensis]KTD22219.1 hypothetical protein Llan_1482 [Legionella lansingensis]SNV55099.1 Uncharacterised protein [Legionella lansingensis]